MHISFRHFQTGLQVGSFECRAPQNPGVVYHHITFSNGNGHTTSDIHHVWTRTKVCHHFLILKKSEIWVFSIFGRRSWFGPSNWSFLGTKKDPMRRTRRASAAPHSQGPQFFWASVALGEQSLALATKIWVNYNDLTATSLRGITPIWP